VQGGFLVLVGPGRPWQPLEGGVEQVAHALAVLGRDPVHALEAEAGEVGGVARLPLRLVHHDEHLLAVAAQVARDLLVVGEQAGPPVHQEKHDVGLLDRALRLQSGGAEQRVVGAEKQASGVDQLERPPLPGDLRVVAVAGGAGPSVGDGLAPAADPVEERGLADVRAPDEGNARKWDHSGAPVDTRNGQSLY